MGMRNALVGVLLGGALLVGCSTPVRDVGTGEPVLLRTTDTVSERSGAGRAWSAYLDRVTERTDGRVRFEPYFSGSLMSNDETYPALAAGVADIGQVTPAQFPSDLPISAWAAQLGSRSMKSFPESTLQLRASAAQYYGSSEAVAREAGQDGTRVLAAGAISYTPMVCTSPVRTPEEARGKRIRVDGGAQTEEARALGMVVVNLPSSDFYEGLQRGVIDCLIAGEGGETFVDLGVLGIARYFTPTLFSPNPGSGMFVNQDSWQSLPLDVRSVFMEELAGYEVDRSRGRLDGYKRFLAGAEAAGVEYVDAGLLNERITAEAENRTATMAGTAPGDLADPAAEVASFSGIIDAWRPKVAQVVDDHAGGGEQTIGELLEAYASGSGGVDWDRYEQQLRAMYTSLPL